jgi:hypothetical protein
MEIVILQQRIREVALPTILPRAHAKKDHHRIFPFAHIGSEKSDMDESADLNGFTIFSIGEVDPQITEGKRHSTPHTEL